jgi:hypothetical protein
MSIGVARGPVGLPPDPTLGARCRPEAADVPRDEPFAARIGGWRLADRVRCYLR